MDLQRIATALKDRYTVEGEIGSGGMATVFLAEDLRHHRKVAIKVLRPELAETVGSERFLREIEIASGLTHPHILPVFDSGEADGVLYYVMPFIEGESLRERLRREGELPVGDAVRLLRDVVDALASAHKRGVVHRDIKPDNILLSENHALVADFGVAKAVSEATRGQTLTAAGAALGTPAYMSPEQASADPHVDHRADLYAVGALAYELLVGEPPFTAATPQQVLSAHVTQAPVPITTRRPTVPAPMADVIMRCLEKRPADRWQTAEELLSQLEGMVTPSAGLTPTGISPAARPARLGRWVGVGAVVVAVVMGGLNAMNKVGGTGAEEDLPPRLVVIPPENRTGDESLDDWTEYAASQFARAADLSGVIDVVPFSVVREAQRSPDGGMIWMASADLAKAVGANVAVVGQFYSAGGELRLDLEILNPESGEGYRQLPTTLGLPEDVEALIAEATGRLMAGVLAEFDPAGAGLFEGMRSPGNPEAFRHIMAGTDHACRREYSQAASELERAVALDSTNIMGWLWLAAAYGNLGTSRSADAQDAVRAAESNSDQATRYERTLTSYHRGWLFGDWEATYRSATDLMALDPRGGAYAAGWSAMFTNRPAAALNHLELFDTEAPCWRNWEPYWEAKAQSLHLLERHEEELDVAREARARYPESRNILDLEIRALIGLGRVSEADSVLDFVLSTPDRVNVGLRAINAALEFGAHGFDEAFLGAAEKAVDWYEADPERANAYPFYLGQARYYAGRYEEALQVFQALTDRYPTATTYLSYLGSTAIQLGQMELAEEADQRLQAIESSAAQRARGFLALVRGDAELAVRLFTEAVNGTVPRVGMRDPWLHRYPELRALKGYPPFDQLSAPRG